ncbi:MULTISPECIES: amino acid adenylation domain-containing protein [unclassified Mycobacterium]|uniref:non-ribosomal peptide synthetase n=1 Tax=unclassified Mycobacterium TaxID=2642494 RepID=UPI0029C7EA67|nr:MULTISPECIES: amino acid adenylation domain-containing protein [unclassified Mycobacterium]
MGVAAVNSTTIREEVAELLGISTGDVDPEADLISQGLDSIRMMSLAGKWRKRGVDVDFASLAANPSVRAWSELVATVEAGDEPSAAVATVQLDADGDEPFPLAPMQHAMWVGRESDQRLGGVAGHLYVEFDGAAIDPDALRQAATALAERHPMLRVEFLPDGTQRIGAQPQGFPVVVEDLRGVAADDVETRLAAIRREKSHQQLTGAVFELALSRLPGDRTRLHVDLDMQAADAMSYRNIMADLASLYRGEHLAPLGYTYRQYRTASSEPAASVEADRQWWSERIPELPDPPRLPLVAETEQADPRRTTRRWHWLAPETRDALFAAARRRGVTPAMALAASFSDALAGWSAEPRFLLNVPMFGREQHHPDVDGLVGDFTSSLLLDVDLAQAHTATERSRAVQATLHAAAAHASYPGLSVLRDLARHRGAQVLAPVVYTSALGLGELFAPTVNAAFGTAVWINSQGPQVLLDAQVTEFDGGVLVNWDVREEAFPAGVIDAMFERHVAELRRLAVDEAAWDARRAPFITAAQGEVRAAANASTAPPSGDNLVDGFFRNAHRAPEATAVIGSTETLTYAELKDKVLSVATALQSRGVGHGDVVAVMGPKNAEQIPALLAILTVGAAYLPIGVDQPADRAARILDTGGVEFALVTGRDMPDVPVPALTVHDAEIIGDPAQFEPTAVTPNDLAYVLFTSGSTGEPKGVELTHDAVMNTLEFLYRHFDIGPGDRALALSHLESDMSVPDVFGTLRVGGAIVVVDEEHRRDPDTWARLIDEHRVTVVNFLPGWLEMLVDVGGSLDSLRVVLTGGDWVRPELARALRKRSPQGRFAGLGGATETAIHGTLFEVVEEPQPNWASIPYGVPFPNNACRVVSATGEDCPDWVPGELWFSGRGIARGYRGRPDLTAAKFVAHDGRTWYRSGDLARYWPDGTLEFIGRVDHRVKLSGYRIELGEVEAALRRVSGVGAAVAAVVPVDGGRDVLGALVRIDDSGLDTAAVATAMADIVPPHMIPTLFVVTDRIPFTLGGKIDRKAVALRLADAELAAGSGYRAPSTHLESALAAILGDVLGRADVGVDDDFFSLGGDSVMATMAVARVRDWLDTPTVMVPDVFAARTVALLANRLSAREPGSDRLEQVAELYLDIAHMDDADVESALDTAATS